MALYISLTMLYRALNSKQEVLSQASEKIILFVQAQPESIAQRSIFNTCVAVGLLSNMGQGAKTC